MSVGFWQSAVDAWGYWSWALIVPLYVYSQLRGDSSARGFASLLAIAALLGTLLESASPASLQIGPARVGCDALLLAGHVVICARSRWLYPILIAAGQLLVVLVEAFAAAGFAAHPAALLFLFEALAVMQFSAFGLGLVRHRSRRPFWPVRTRRENASAELAPRANDAR